MTIFYLATAQAILPFRQQLFCVTKLHTTSKTFLYFTHKEFYIKFGSKDEEGPPSTKHYGTQKKEEGGG